MSNTTQHDPMGKALLRRAWGSLLSVHAFASTVTSGGKGAPRVYYGGARSGNLGGPLVKVKRLQQYFPESLWRYNVVYALSNAPYLPALALGWLRRRGIPIVLNQNGVFYPGWFAGDWERQNAIMSAAYHQASHVFWQSEFCRKAATRFLGERQGTGEVLYNAIDVQHFRPGDRRDERPFTFLITGKIGRHLGYRLESTIEGLAFARRAGLDARLNIAGWVEAPVAVRAASVRHGVANVVALSDTYTQEEAPDIYRAADAYVMTNYLDNCPSTVLEAMACGLPVLYSHSGGVPELVGPDAGIGLPLPEDWEKVHVPTAAAIGEGMLKMAQHHQGMAAAARSRAVACFDISTWIARHRVVFERLLQNRQ